MILVVLILRLYKNIAFNQYDFTLILRALITLKKKLVYYLSLFLIIELTVSIAML